MGLLAQDKILCKQFSRQVHRAPDPISAHRSHALTIDDCTRRRLRFTFWNAYLARKIMVQVPLRALGPHLVDKVLNGVFPDGFDALSPRLQRAFFLAIREQVTSVGYFSPTLLLLIAALRPHLDRLNLSNGPPDFANALPHLSPIDGCRVVESVALLTSFDGTNVMAERKTLTRLRRTLGLPPQP